MLSVLIVPGGDEAAFAAGLAAAPDILVLDIGPPEEGPSQSRCRALARLSPAPRCPDGPRLFARIHPVTSPHVQADFEAAIAAGLEGVMLANTIGRPSIEQLGAKLAVCEAEADLEHGATRILACVETAEGALAAESLARAGPRLAGIAWNAWALLAELGVPRGAEPAASLAAPCLYVRAAIALAARVAGVPALDGSWEPVGDGLALAETLARSRRDGFGGKLTRHPSHVGAIRSA